MYFLLICLYSSRTFLHFFFFFLQNDRKAYMSAIRDLPLLDESNKLLFHSPCKHMGTELQRITHRLTDSWCSNFQSTF